jgi:hypothetical protein
MVRNMDPARIGIRGPKPDRRTPVSNPLFNAALQPFRVSLTPVPSIR